MSCTLCISISMSNVFFIRTKFCKYCYISPSNDTNYLNHWIKTLTSNTSARTGPHVPRKTGDSPRSTLYCDLRKLYLTLRVPAILCPHRSFYFYLFARVILPVTWHFSAPLAKIFCRDSVILDPLRIFYFSRALSICTISYCRNTYRDLSVTGILKSFFGQNLFTFN